MIRRNHASMLGLRISSHRYNVYGIKQVIKLSLITCLIQLSQAINSPSVPTAVGKCKIGAPDKPCGGGHTDANSKTVAIRYMIENKLVPLHYES